MNFPIWPLTYTESDGGEPRVLTPNTILWGEDSYILEDQERDESEVTKMDKRVKLPDNTHETVGTRNTFTVLWNRTE